MRDSVPSTSYSSVCNVLRQWNISLIPTYRVYRLYDKDKLYTYIDCYWGVYIAYLPQDKYLRALAETENVRQRMKKQVEDSKLYGIQEFSKDILNVADILRKATKSVHETSLKQQDKQLNALYDGVKMTEAELQKALQKHGITQIDPVGQLFDPVFHEAMFEVEGEKPGTIAHVSAIGYTLHGRTIRPAKVGVVRS